MLSMSWLLLILRTPVFILSRKLSSATRKCVWLGETFVLEQVSWVRHSWRFSSSGGKFKARPPFGGLKGELNYWIFLRHSDSEIFIRFCSKCRGISRKSPCQPLNAANSKPFWLYCHRDEGFWILMLVDAVCCYKTKQFASKLIISSFAALSAGVSTWSLSGTVERWLDKLINCRFLQGWR